MKKIIRGANYNSPMYQRAVGEFLPDRGEGDNLATQTVTAVNRLVWGWYNDGDVYDNTKTSLGWANDLSSYANWLYKYVPRTQTALEGIYSAYNDDEYENLLEDIIDAAMDYEDLSNDSERPAKGSIYGCDGPFAWEEPEDDEYY